MHVFPCYCPLCSDFRVVGDAVGTVRRYNDPTLRYDPFEPVSKLNMNIVQASGDASGAKRKVVEGRKNIPHRILWSALSDHYKDLIHNSKFFTCLGKGEQRVRKQEAYIVQLLHPSQRPACL